MHASLRPPGVKLPANHPRYRNDWLEGFEEAAREVLRPGSVVLDVGGGRRPAIPRDARPPGVRYVGLDLSRSELEAAEPGSYDEMIEGDIVHPIPSLEARFDLIVSWQVLEHVASMDAAVANVRRYLRPGGRFVGHLSGGRALFALVNRAVPHRLAVLIMSRLLGRDPRLVFPATYDSCTYSELTRLLADWSSRSVVPRYRGAQYFSFIPGLQRVYLALEDVIANGRHRDLATHYLVVADR